MKTYILLLCSILTFQTVIKPSNAVDLSRSSESKSDAGSISLVDDDRNEAHLGETALIKETAQALAQDKNATRKATAAIGVKITRKREELLQRKLDWQSRIDLLNSEIDSLRNTHERYTQALTTTTQSEASYKALYLKLREERDALKFHQLLDDDQSESDEDALQNNNDDDQKSELSVDDAKGRVQNDLGNILDPSNEAIKKILEDIRASLQSLKDLQVQLESKRKLAITELQKVSANHQAALESVYEIEEATLALKKAHPTAVVDEVVESIEERREEEGKRGRPAPVIAQPEKNGCLLL